MALKGTILQYFSPIMILIVLVIFMHDIAPKLGLSHVLFLERRRSLFQIDQLSLELAPLVFVLSTLHLESDPIDLSL